jgi:glycosyltransferase involved in cell wall biosynthesis
MTPLVEPFRQILPDLADYRREFLAAGVALPLTPAPWRAEGLLATLPPPTVGRRGWPWTTQTESFATPLENWPKITIVAPSYQQGDYLEENLRSVLLQNYPRLEFIVMDGGSTDASPTVIERYRPWLSYAQTARDRGQAHAINLGFSLAAGEIFGWLNSDDFLLPGALRRVAEAWRSGAEFIYGDGLELDQATGRRRYATANFAHSRYVKFPGLVHQHSTFWSAARHQSVWEEQHCAIDYELWIRLLPGLRVRHIDWALAVARQHGEAKTFNPAIKQRWAEDAERNGLAHPALYRRRPWLDREYRLVQRIVHSWRARGGATRCERLRGECGWGEPVSPPL